MAPKIKICYEDILSEAIGIVRENGIEAVNARSVAARLNCSIQPIFRTFGTMEELRTAVYENAEKIYNSVMLEAMENSNEGFLGMGFAYINFAKSESNLFRLLFMSNVFGKRSVTEIAGTTQSDEAVIALIEEMTGLTPSKSRELFSGIWFTVHGIASLLATNHCVISDDEVRRILKNSFRGLEYSLKNEKDGNQGDGQI